MSWIEKIKRFNFFLWLSRRFFLEFNYSFLLQSNIAEDIKSEIRFIIHKFSIDFLYKFFQTNDKVLKKHSIYNPKTAGISTGRNGIGSAYEMQSARFASACRWWKKSPLLGRLGGKPGKSHCLVVHNELNFTCPPPSSWKALHVDEFCCFFWLVLICLEKRLCLSERKSRNCKLHAMWLLFIFSIEFFRVKLLTFITFGERII